MNENQVSFDKSFFDKNYVSKKAVATDVLMLHSKTVNMCSIILVYSILLVGFARFSLMAGVVGALALGVSCGIILMNSRKEIIRIAKLYEVEQPKTILHYFKNIGEKE